MFRFRYVRCFFYLACLISFAFLNGCSTTGQKDGPPPYDVDVSKIPDAVPKKESPSKYGNLSSYRVFGKSYYTMKSSKNYHEQGIASWYGSKFHRRNTSSGERYNMLSMTAAHKTLPLPTYVQVTNLANGKKVVVKVNDRGPFESNRLIDLSYVAAKKLGMIGHGTAHVDVQAIDPEEGRSTFMAENTKTRTIPHFSIPTRHEDGKGYYLQVGAFQNRAYAEKLKHRLASMVSSPVQITPLVSSSRHLYRVQIGPIKDILTADDITKRLKTIGIHDAKKITV